MREVQVRSLPCSTSFILVGILTQHFNMPKQTKILTKNIQTAIANVDHQQKAILVISLRAYCELKLLARKI